nr:MAG TPA: hypothetical protein [Caudoviricetes sp.]
MHLCNSIGAFLFKCIYITSYTLIFSLNRQKFLLLALMQ